MSQADVLELAPKLQGMLGDIPMWLPLGWISVESAGRIGTTPPVLPGQTDPERGFFQLHPDESRSLGLDHSRLSIDEDYSLAGGLALIRKYADQVAATGLPYGSDLFWHVVKFFHSIGSGAATKMLGDMASHGQAPAEWDDVTSYAKANEDRLFSLLKHSPTKWSGNVTSVSTKGKVLSALAIPFLAARDVATKNPVLTLLGILTLGGLTYLLLSGRTRSARRRSA